MRCLHRKRPAATIMLLICGCAPAPTTTEEDGGRLHHVLGALQIRAPKERDAALAEACGEAAELGEGPVVLMGLPKIADPALRDETAERSAVALQAGGKLEEARQAAELIQNEDKRKEILDSLMEE